MWIMLNRSFLSIVDKSTAAHSLLVRARRAGDIEAVFPAAKVRKDGGTDYAFRADIARADVATAIAREVMNITYPNFKGSVKDDARHDAYMGVWNVMMDFQRGRFDRKPRRFTNHLRRNVNRSIDYDQLVPADIDRMPDIELPAPKRSAPRRKPA